MKRDAILVCIYVAGKQVLQTHVWKWPTPEQREAAMVRLAKQICQGMCIEDAVDQRDADIRAAGGQVRKPRGSAKRPAASAGQPEAPLNNEQAKKNTGAPAAAGGSPAPQAPPRRPGPHCPQAWAPPLLAPFAMDLAEEMCWATPDHEDVEADVMAAIEQVLG